MSSGNSRDLLALDLAELAREELLDDLAWEAGLEPEPEPVRPVRFNRYGASNDWPSSAPLGWLPKYGPGSAERRAKYLKEKEKNDD